MLYVILILKNLLYYVKLLTSKINLKNQFRFSKKIIQKQSIYLHIYALNREIYNLKFL